MNSTSAVTVWNDKSGQSNTMTGSGTWSGGTMVFNGTTDAFSNLAYVFPFGAYSMFAVYSNTTPPASTAYMNAVYGSNGFPMLGVYDANDYVSARSVVANTGSLVGAVPTGWAAQIAGTGSDIGRGIATDPSGNVFVTGRYGAALTLYNTGGGIGTTLPFAGGNVDCFVAKYSSAGVVLWAAQIASTGDETPYAIATDPSGNVFVTGQCSSALTVYNTGGGIGATVSASGDAVFIAKYLPHGVVSWAARIESPGADFGYEIAADPSGNVFVTGQYGAALTLYNTGGGIGATLGYVGSNDCFVAKYSSAGVVLWAAQIASTTVTSSDIGSGIATDPSGNVFVTGQYAAALTLYNTGGGIGATLGHAGSNDCFVAKYSSAGAVLWAARIASTTASSSDQGRAIATNTSGDVFVTGIYNAALTLYNTGGGVGATLGYAGSSDAFLAKYSSAGAVLWAAQIAGIVNDAGNGIATDAAGNVFVTGFYGTNTLTLYNTGGGIGVTLPSGVVIDCFVAKYSPAGVVLWAVQIAGTGNDQGYAIATDSAGSVLVTGEYTGAPIAYNADGTPGATLATAAGSSDCFVVKYNPNGFITTALTSASSNVLVSATYTPSTFSPFVNGFAQTTLAGTTLATTGIFVGGPSNYFSGSISEVLIFGTTLTAVQRQSVEGYLSRKWGIGIGLLSTHPFYTIPPFNRYFNPTDVPGCTLWLDGADNSSMNSTTTVTSWSDKSGLNNTMTGTATWSGRSMTFNGTTQAFSNLSYVFPVSAYSMFGVYSNTTPPAATAYMNAVYGSNGFPMLGTFGVAKDVSARSVVANTGQLLTTTQLGWAARIAGAGTSNDIGNGIATDPSGNVVVTGRYGSALTIYNQGSSGTAGTTLSNAGNNDCFVAKYSPDGAVLWAARSGGTSSDQGNGIATDTSGNVLVVGQFSSTAFKIYNQGPTETIGITLSNAGNNDCFVAKYSPDGAVLWAAQIAGTGSDIGRGIATDPSGNVFVTGSYDAALTIYDKDGIGVVTLPFIAGVDCFVAKYSSAGAVLWAARIAGTSISDTGFGVATDSSGNVVVSGQYGTTVGFYNQGPTGGTLSTTLQTTGGGADCFVAKYSPAGAVLWAAQVGSTTGDSGNGIATDSSGNVFVTGNYAATLTVYNQGPSRIAATTLPVTGSIDCFVVKYTPDGLIAAAAAAASSNVLVSATYTPSTFSPFVNGSNTGTLAGTTLATTGIFVGGPSNYFSGSISELLIYASTLSVAQRQQVEGYLIQKWGLSAQTLSNHQYKLISPASVVPFQPANISTPLVWFDAADTSTISFSTGSVVARWLNKGSSGANATALVGSLTSGVTTLNGLNLVNCPASANLGFTVGIPNQPRAWFAVFRLTSQLTTTGTTQYFALINQTTGSGQDAISGPMSPTNIATNTYSIGEGSTGLGTNINTVTAPNGFNVMKQYGYINSAASTSSNFITVNGSPMTLSTSLAASGYTTTSVLYTFGDIYGGSGADIAEVILFNTELTTPQRQQIEGYLGWKWGIGNTLPATHPYYKYPPALP
jgi:hypothetical protein